MPILINAQSAPDRFADMYFMVRYLPRAVGDSLKFALYGGVLGLLVGNVYEGSLSKFARQHHNAVDVNNSYVPDDQEFLHLSRNRNFTQVTPSINKILPLYSAALGAGAGFFVGVLKNKNEFLAALSRDRNAREDEHLSITLNV